MPLYTKSLAVFAVTILGALVVTSNTITAPKGATAVGTARLTAVNDMSRDIFRAGRSAGLLDQLAAEPTPPAETAAAGEGQAPEPPPPPVTGYAGSSSGGSGGGGGDGGGIVVGSGQQALINSDRAASGLGPLTWNGCLAGVAVQNAQRMVAAGGISHADGPSRDLACGLGSSQAGENVGYWTGGINDSQLNSMFMASAGHRANILGPYRYVGTAWAVAPNGTAYIAVEFA